jgi:hypothetical protein
VNERDEIRLPESTGGLFELAFVSYGRRLPLYLGFAALALAVQCVLTFACPKNLGLMVAANMVLDGFLCGLVTVGIVADLRSREPRDTRAIIGDTVARWWVLVLVYTVTEVVVVQSLLETLEPQDPMMLFLSPIYLLFWAAISLATVVAAVDRTTNEALLPILSIGRSLQIGLPFVNLRRLSLFALALLLPLVVEILLQNVLTMRHVRDAGFWANAPIDALTVGPLQAIATIFYLDFVRRLAARP